MATLTSFLGGLADRFTAWRERERAFAELSALDDRTLADLGLHRGDIPFVVYCKSRQRASAPSVGSLPTTAGNKGLHAA